MTQRIKPSLLAYIDQHYAPQGGARKFIEMYTERATGPDIAQHFGVVEDTAWRWMRTYKRSKRIDSLSNKEVG